MNYQIPPDIEKALESPKVDVYIKHNVRMQVDEKERKKEKLDFSKIMIPCLILVSDTNIQLDGIGSRLGSLCTLFTSADKFPDAVNHPDVISIEASR